MSFSASLAAGSNVSVAVLRRLDVSPEGNVYELALICVVISLYVKIGACGWRWNT